MRAVLVFCEGNHDVVFVSRSLGAVAGCKWSKERIRDLPSPLGPKVDPRDPNKFVFDSLITKHYRAQKLEDLQPRPAAHAPVPTFEAVVRDPSTLIYYVLIRCNGDGASGRSIKLIEDFRNTFPFHPDITQIASAFVFDADADVSARAAAFTAAYARCLQPGAAMRHDDWMSGPLGPAGLYIFHDPATRAGTLEDSLAPLVEAQWKDRWDAAGRYLTAHARPEDPVSLKLAERHKAQINVTGQFLFPGDPMTMVLERDGLQQRHFAGPTSQSLVAFLRRAPF